MLITGAKYGIGAVTAGAFAEQGAAVFLSYYCQACAYSEEELARAREVGIRGDVLYRAEQQERVEPLARDIVARGGRAVDYEASQKMWRAPLFYWLRSKHDG